MPNLLTSIVEAEFFTPRAASRDSISWVTTAMSASAIVSDICVACVSMSHLSFGTRFFNTSSCSRRRVMSWGLSFRRYSMTFPETPLPVTTTPFDAVEVLPPSLIRNVVPCCPPAG